MRTTLERHVEALVGTAIKLYEQGLRDPSVPELALAMFHKAPPEHPLMRTDEIGGEVYDGVAKRLKILRDALDERGFLTAPIGEEYYKRGLRHHTPESHEVRVCLPNSSSRPYGIRFVVEGEEDLIYAEYLRSKGTAMATGLDRTGNQTLRANQARALGRETAQKLAGEFGARLTITPAEISKRLNGPATIT